MSTSLSTVGANIGLTRVDQQGEEASTGSALSPPANLANLSER